jgi:type I restriction enzyme S subunit
MLPTNWKTMSLGEVVSHIGNGLTANQNKNGQGLAITRIETIAEDTVDESRVGFVSDVADEVVAKYRLATGDILFSHINSEPQIGRAVIYEGKPETLLHGMNLLRLRVKQELLLPSFLAFLFKYYRGQGVFVGLASRAVGQSSINQGRLKTLEVLLPPVVEQGAIVSVLSAVKRAEEARQSELFLERERKATLLDYLFTHGTSGAEPTTTEVGQLPEGWNVVSLGEVAEITYGIQAAVAHLNDPTSGIPILTNINIKNDGRLDFTKLRYFRLPERLQERGLLKRGDVLFNWRSGSQDHVGKTALFNEEREMTYSSFILRLRPSDKLRSLFLAYYLHAIKARRYFVQNRQQSSVNSVFNASVAASIPVGLPPLQEQDEIAAVLEAVDRKIAALEKENELIKGLFEAILEELMTGRLSALPLTEEYQADD